MNLDVVNEYTFLKHNILPGSQTNCITDIARSHLGLHSARIITPYTTLCSRMNQYKPDMLTNQLFGEKNLIKIRCVRTTLHMVPFDIASILHKSTIKLRLSGCKLYFKRNHIPLSFIEHFHDVLVNFIDVPKANDEIEAQIITELSSIDNSRQKECAKKILKYFWETGLLCYVNTASSWEKEQRKYSLTQNYYPNLKLDEYDFSTAQELLIIEYINKFGPATIKDLSWWSGLSINTIKKTIKNNNRNFEILRIKGYDIDFYISAKEAEMIRKYKPLNTSWISLLAYEDPSLKGYFESRFRYVEKRNYKSLFNSIGEVRASIIYNGKAIGVWDWDKKNKRINLNYFTSPDIIVSRKVDNIKEKFEIMLSTN